MTAAGALGPRVLIVADGDVDPAVLAHQAFGATLVFAADGGAGRALAAGVLPDLVVGDGDSLSADERSRLVALDVTIRDADPDKDESDTELCLLAAVDMDASCIVMVGALGGPRPEHAVANLLLLADERLDGIDVQLLDGASRLTRIGSADVPARLVVNGSPGDWVSLLALAGDVVGVRTEGLRYRLDGDRLTTGPARGLSNELLGTEATVTTDSGRLLVIHTPRIQDSRIGRHA